MEKIHVREENILRENTLIFWFGITVEKKCIARGDETEISFKNCDHIILKIKIQRMSRSRIKLDVKPKKQSLYYVTAVKLIHYQFTKLEGKFKDIILSHSEADPIQFLSLYLKQRKILKHGEENYFFKYVQSENLKHEDDIYFI